MVRQQKLPDLENNGQITQEVIYVTKPSNYKRYHQNYLFWCYKEVILVTICIDMGTWLERKLSR